MDTEKIKELMNDRGVVLVEFYATWCPHCQRMAPVVDDVAALMQGVANVYRFDIDKNRDFADELHVESLPTFIIYKDHQEVWRTAGELDGNVLVSHLQDALK